MPVVHRNDSHTSHTSTHFSLSHSLPMFCLYIYSLCHRNHFRDIEFFMFSFQPCPQRHIHNTVMPYQPYNTRIPIMIFSHWHTISNRNENVFGFTSSSRHSCVYMCVCVLVWESGGWQAKRTKLFQRKYEFYFLTCKWFDSCSSTSFQRDQIALRVICHTTS